MPFDATSDIIEPEARPARTVRAIVFTNPFSGKDRQVIDVDWAAEKTVADYLGPLPEHITWGVVAAGRELQPEELATTTLAEHDSIVLVAQPEKGIGQVMLMLALVVTAIVAGAYLGPLLAPTVIMGISISAATAGAIVTAVITTIGGFLINALLPPDKPKPDQRSANSDSPSYGLDGPKPTAKEEMPVAAIYGKYRLGGNRVNYYATNSSDGKSQELFVQYALGEGPVQSISGLEIDQRPASDFGDWSMQTRLGDLVQAPYDWFPDIITPYNDGRTVNVGPMLYTTDSAVPIDAVRLDISFPTGLYSVNSSNGNLENRQVTVYASLTPYAGGVPITFQSTFSAESRVVLRYSMYSPTVPRGRYVLRVWRGNIPTDLPNIQDNCVLSTVNEMQYEPMQYPRTAGYALRIKLTDQFSREPSPTVLVEGRKLIIYDANGQEIDYRWSDNPADVALDVMTHEHWGRRVHPSRINWAWFAEWRAFCTAMGLKFNAALDFLSNTWDTLTTIFRVGRASPMVSGLRWSGVIERASDPTMMFGMQNILKGTFENFWIGKTGRSNHIEGQFYDENDGYRRQSVWAVDETAIAQGAEMRQGTINLLGITNAAQAQAEVDLQLRLNMRMSQGARFRASLDAIGCQIGDVVYVQHDMPKWGWADRVASVASATVNLSSPLLNEGAPLPVGDWRLLVLKGAKLASTATVVTASGSQIQVIGTGKGNIGRVIIGGVDYGVLNRAEVPGNTVYRVDRTVTGVSPGASAELWLINEMTELVINQPSAGDTAVTLASGSDIGKVAAGDQIMLGRVNHYKKPFRITQISYDNDHTRQIEVMEYDPWVYDPSGTVPVDNSSELQSAPLHVLNLAAEPEYLDVHGGGVRYLARASWNRPLNDLRGHAGSHVYVSYGGVGAAWNYFAFVDDNRQSAQVEVPVNTVVGFKVVAADRNGVRASFASAPTAYVTMGARGRVPTVPSSLTATAGIKLIAVRWAVPADADVKLIEVWESASASQGSSYLVQSSYTSSYTAQNLAPNTQRWYWIRSISYAGQPSAWVGPVSATSSYLLAADIADGIISTAKFASSIKPVRLITNRTLSVDISGSAINDGDLVAVVSENGKLYRRTGSSYIAIIEPGGAGGLLSSAQIESLAAAKLAGQIVGTQIGDGQISTAKIAANAVTANEIAANAVTADEIAANAVTANELAAGAVVAGKIAADAVTAGTVAAGAINAREIAAGAIRADKLASEEIISQTIQVANLIVGTEKFSPHSVSGVSIGEIGAPWSLDPAWGYSNVAETWIVIPVTGQGGAHVMIDGAAQFSSSGGNVWVRSPMPDQRVILEASGGDGGPSTYADLRLTINGTPVFPNRFYFLGEGWHQVVLEVDPGSGGGWPTVLQRYVQALIVKR